MLRGRRRVGFLFFDNRKEEDAEEYCAKALVHWYHWIHHYAPAQASSLSLVVFLIFWPYLNFDINDYDYELPVDEKKPSKLVSERFV